jgi:hypothetical protein
MSDNASWVLQCQKSALPAACCSRLFLYVNKRGPTYNIVHRILGLATGAPGMLQILALEAFTCRSLLFISSLFNGVTGSETYSVEKLDDIVP